MILIIIITAHCLSAADFGEKDPEITVGISAALGSIANEAMSSDLITSDDYQTCILPDAGHLKLSTNRVLREIEVLLKNKPEKIDVFIAILKREGPPISHLGDAISKPNRSHISSSLSLLHSQRTRTGALLN